MKETVLFQEIHPQALFGREFPTLRLGIVLFGDIKEGNSSRNPHANPEEKLTRRI